MDRFSCVMTSVGASFAVGFAKWRHGRGPHAKLLPASSRQSWLVRVAALILLAVLIVSSNAAAAGDGCNDDCRNEYVSALGDCRTRYENGDKDLQDLEDCLVDTRSEYDDCLDDCTALGAGGVIACAALRGAIRPVIFAGTRRR